MPLYTFRCTNGHSVDRLVRSANVGTVVCEDCNEPMRKQDVYAPATHIAGAVAAPNGSPERRESDKRALNRRGWDYSRALETISKNRIDDGSGIKKLNIAAMNAEGRA